MKLEKGKQGQQMASALMLNVADLIRIKSIVTLCVIFTFCFKTLQGVQVTSEFVMIATAVITYYFTKEKEVPR